MTQNILQHPFTSNTKPEVSKKMKLLNYRLGFASNSSSLHSTWHVEDINEIYDEIEDMNFSWGHFVCSSRENIRRYLASQYITSLLENVPNDVIISVVKNFFPEIPEEDYSCDGSDGKEITAGVDHQSQISLPHDYFSNNPIFPSIKFLRDIEEYLIKTNGVIIGGNDNEDLIDLNEVIPKHQHKYREYYLDQLTEIGSTENIVCLKDGKVWKLFNQKTGEKMRFSFDDNVKYDKSDTPELIDLIITNNCNVGCPHCYRNCTPNGKHADFGFVKEIIRALEERTLHVLEVAIGGGDILEYPQLEQLCSYLHYHNVQPIVFNTTLNCHSFTPKNIDKIRRVFESFSGIAISISNIRDVENVLNYIRENRISFVSRNISFQCIPELMSYQDIVDVATGVKDRAYSRVTFLGFKHTGRGNSSQFSAAAGFEKNKEPFRKALDEIREKKGFFRTYGVDTELIKNFPELKETQAEWSYTEEEGKFSCCIDAVDRYILPSSYSEYKDEYKIPTNLKTWDLDNFIYKQFQKF